MTNKKSHMPFRLVPKSTILDDLERPIRTLLQKRCVFRSPPQKNWMKIDPYYQRQKCKPLTVVSGDKVYADIRRGSRGGGVKRQWGCRQRQFSALQTLDMRPASRSPSVRSTRYAVHRLLFIDPKTCDLEWPWLAISRDFRKIIVWKLIKIVTYCQPR